MAETDVNLTYETIFEILVREKSREELQKLPLEFYANLSTYLSEKKALLTNSDETSFDKNAKQLQNIYRIARELYERREKKIVSMAMACSKAKSMIVDTSTLLPEEKILFDVMLREFDFYRAGIIDKVLAAKLPNISKQEVEKQEEKRNIRLVRFLHAVPKFVGSELEVYGPFEEEDVASLPPDIAEVLIKKGRAEEISDI